MLTYTYVSEGTFALMEKPKPVLQHERDAIVKVTLASICSSDLHIKHGSVPRAVPGITVGHEMVGIVEEVGSAVTNVKPGDRVTVNVETFCGECFFCKKGFVNNCTDQNGGWALGCRIDGGQAEYVRVPFADQGLNKIPDGVTDRQALLVGDVLATGFWAARISEITPEASERVSAVSSLPASSVSCNDTVVPLFRSLRKCIRSSFAILSPAHFQMEKRIHLFHAMTHLRQNGFFGAERAVPFFCFRGCHVRVMV